VDMKDAAPNFWKQQEMSASRPNADEGRTTEARGEETSLCDFQSTAASEKLHNQAMSDKTQSRNNSAVAVN